MSAALLITTEADLKYLNPRLVNSPQLELITFSSRVAAIAEKLYQLRLKKIDAQISRNEVKPIYDLSDNLARKYDQILADVRRHLLNKDVPTLGWHYMRIFYALHAIQKIFSLISAARKDLTRYAEIFVFDAEIRFDFHENSSFIKNVFGYSLLYTGLTCRKIAVESKPLNATLSLDIPPGDWKLLVYSPTIFYPEDRSRFKTYAAPYLNKNILSIPSPSWNSQLFESSAQFTEHNISCSNNDQSIFSSNYQHTESVRRTLDNLFDEKFSGAEIGKYVQFVDDSLTHETLQINVLRQLLQSPHLKKIEAALVCEHDGGLQGPILSFALMRKARITLLPHSTVQTNPVVGHSSITRIACREEASLNLDLGHGKSKKLYSIKRLAPDKASTKKIIFIFNQITDMYRFDLIDFQGFEKALSDAISTLHNGGWQVGIRVKPNSFLPEFSLLKIDHHITSCDGHLATWLDWPSHVCSLFTPTSALLKFWEAGCVCFHLQDIELCSMEIATLPPKNTHVIAGDEYKDLFPALTRRLLAN
jgi:hypothetical protein